MYAQRLHTICVHIVAMQQAARNKSLGPALRNIGFIFVDEYNLKREGEPGAGHLSLHGSRPCNNIHSLMHSFTQSFMHQTLTEHLPSTLCCQVPCVPRELTVSSMISFVI